MNSSYFILRSSVNTIKITHGNHDYSILDFAQPMAKLTFLIALSLLAFSAASVLPHLFRKPLLCHPTMPLSLMHQRRIASLSQFLFQIPITNPHSMYIQFLMQNNKSTPSNQSSNPNPNQALVANNQNPNLRGSTAPASDLQSTSPPFAENIIQGR